MQLREDVVRHVLAMMPVASIAREVGLHRSRISEILNEPEVQQKLAQARTTAFRDAQAVLRQGTRRAAGRLLELMESDSGHVALRAAIEILSKAGADAPKKFDLGLLANATDEELWEQLEELKNGRGESAGGN